VFSQSGSEYAKAYFSERLTFKGSGKSWFRQEYDCSAEVVVRDVGLKITLKTKQKALKDYGPCR